MSALRSFPDCLRQLLLFEIIGLALVAPLASGMTGHGIGAISILALVIPLIAIFWSGMFNYLYDRVELARGCACPSAPVAADHLIRHRQSKRCADTVTELTTNLQSFLLGLLQNVTVNVHS
jgi:uncharacterized membrane protein